MKIITLSLCISVMIIYPKCTIAQTKKTPKATIITTNKIKEKQYTKLSLKTGVSSSVVYLARNIKENNNEPGFCGGLTYGINNFLRVSSLYTHYRTINIAPTWYNVKANTYEINIETLAKFPNKKTLLYPFIGLSYNTFKGFFTGQADYLNLKEYYLSNSTVKNNWLGLNLGTGLEHNFGVLGLFIDYRMRVGKQEKAFNIMDVCYTAGVKINFPYGKLAKTIFSSNDRFYWF